MSENEKKYLLGEQLLIRLKQEDWDDLIPKLQAYAETKIKAKCLYFTQELKQVALDIANEAIEKLWTEERKWDINYYKTVYSFLLGAIDSLISSYFKEVSKNKKVSLYVTDVRNKTITDNDFEAADLKNNVDELFNDDVDAGLVFDLIVQGCKPSDISKELGIEINKVYNAIKRVNRKLLEAQKLIK